MTNRRPIGATQARRWLSVAIALAATSQLAAEIVVNSKFVDGHGLKIFTVSDRIKGNDCTCACHCVAAKTPLLHDLRPPPPPDSRAPHQFVVRKVIHKYECRCACSCSPHVEPGEDRQMTIVDSYSTRPVVVDERQIVHPPARPPIVDDDYAATIGVESSGSSTTYLTGPPSAVSKWQNLGRHLTGPFSSSPSTLDVDTTLVGREDESRSIAPISISATSTISTVSEVDVPQDQTTAAHETSATTSRLVAGSTLVPTRVDVTMAESDKTTTRVSMSSVTPHDDQEAVGSDRDSSDRDPTRADDLSSSNTQESQMATTTAAASTNTSNHDLVQLNDIKTSNSHVETPTTTSPSDESETVEESQQTKIDTSTNNESNSRSSTSTTFVDSNRSTTATIESNESRLDDTTTHSTTAVPSIVTDEQSPDSTTGVNDEVVRRQLLESSATSSQSSTARPTQRVSSHMTADTIDESTTSEPTSEPTGLEISSGPFDSTFARTIVVTDESQDTTPINDDIAATIASSTVPTIEQSIDESTQQIESVASPSSSHDEAVQTTTIATLLESTTRQATTLAAAMTTTIVAESAVESSSDDNTSRPPEALIDDDSSSTIVDSPTTPIPEAEDDTTTNSPTTSAISDQFKENVNELLRQLRALKARMNSTTPATTIVVEKTDIPIKTSSLSTVDVVESLVHQPTVSLRLSEAGDRVTQLNDQLSSLMDDKSARSSSDNLMRRLDDMRSMIADMKTQTFVDNTTTVDSSSTSTTISSPTTVTQRRSNEFDSEVSTIVVSERVATDEPTSSTTSASTPSQQTITRNEPIRTTSSIARRLHEQLARLKQQIDIMRHVAKDSTADSTTTTHFEMIGVSTPPITTDSSSSSIVSSSVVTSERSPVGEMQSQLANLKHTLDVLKTRHHASTPEPTTPELSREQLTSVLAQLKSRLGELNKLDVERTTLSVAVTTVDPTPAISTVSTAVPTTSLGGTAAPEWTIEGSESTISIPRVSTIGSADIVDIATTSSVDSTSPIIEPSSIADTTIAPQSSTPSDTTRPAKPTKVELEFAAESTFETRPAHDDRVSTSPMPIVTTTTRIDETADAIVNVTRLLSTLKGQVETSAATTGRGVAPSTTTRSPSPKIVRPAISVVTIVEPAVTPIVVSSTSERRSHDASSSVDTTTIGTSTRDETRPLLTTIATKSQAEIEQPTSTTVPIAQTRATTLVRPTIVAATPMSPASSRPPTTSIVESTTTPIVESTTTPIVESTTTPIVESTTTSTQQPTAETSESPTTRVSTTPTRPVKKTSTTIHSPTSSPSTAQSSIETTTMSRPTSRVETLTLNTKRPETSTTSKPQSTATSSDIAISSSSSSERSASSIETTTRLSTLQSTIETPTTREDLIAFAVAHDEASLSSSPTESSPPSPTEDLVLTTLPAFTFVSVKLPKPATTTIVSVSSPLTTTSSSTRVSTPPTRFSSTSSSPRSTQRPITSTTTRPTVDTMTTTTSLPVMTSTRTPTSKSPTPSVAPIHDATQTHVEQQSVVESSAPSQDDDAQQPVSILLAESSANFEPHRDDDTQHEPRRVGGRESVALFEENNDLTIHRFVKPDEIAMSTTSRSTTSRSTTTTKSSAITTTTPTVAESLDEETSVEVARAAKLGLEISNRVRGASAASSIDDDNFLDNRSDEEITFADRGGDTRTERHKIDLTTVAVDSMTVATTRRPTTIRTTNQAKSTTRRTTKLTTPRLTKTTTDSTTTVESTSTESPTITTPTPVEAIGSFRVQNSIDDSNAQIGVLKFEDFDPATLAPAVIPTLPPVTIPTLPSLLDLFTPPTAAVAVVTSTPAATAVETMVAVNTTTSERPPWYRENAIGPEIVKMVPQVARMVIDTGAQLPKLAPLLDSLKPPAAVASQLPLAPTDVPLHEPLAAGAAVATFMPRRAPPHTTTSRSPSSTTAASPPVAASSQHPPLRRRRPLPSARPLPHPASAEVYDDYEEHSPRLPPNAPTRPPKNVDLQRAVDQSLSRRGQTTSGEAESSAAAVNDESRSSSSDVDISLAIDTPTEQVDKPDVAVVSSSSGEQTPRRLSLPPPSRAQPAAVDIETEGELIERLDEARRLRENLELDAMRENARARSGIQFESSADRRAAIEHKLAELVKAERLHRTLLERRQFSRHEQSPELSSAPIARPLPRLTAESSTPTLVDTADHTTTTTMTPTSDAPCEVVRRFSRHHRIDDPRTWIRTNCESARRQFPGASCAQIEQLLGSCFESPSDETTTSTIAITS